VIYFLKNSTAGNGIYYSVGEWGTKIYYLVNLILVGILPALGVDSAFNRNEYQESFGG
jgi:hypothetical protein